MAPLPWYVVTNSEGLILGVFGGALEDFAQERAQAIATETGMPVFLRFAWFRARPHVGFVVARPVQKLPHSSRDVFPCAIN